MTQTGVFLPSREFYLGDRNSSTLLLYERQYVDVMKALGANVTTAVRDAVDIVDFEILVANVSDNDDDDDDDDDD